MSNLPHTLDNLSKKEKDRVVDMLKQLNELKKKCTGLEQQLESKQLENERLSGREEVMRKQLEATESKLLEAIQLSKESQNEIEQLSLKVQKSESEKKQLNTRLRDAHAETQSLKDAIREIRLKHEKVLVSAAVQCKIITCDRSSNTEDTSLNLQNAVVQVPAETSFTGSGSAHIASVPRQTSGIQTNPLANEASTGEYQTEADDDLSQPICILNQL